MSIIIKGAQVFERDRGLRQVERFEIPSSSTRELEAQGKWLIPGLCDLGVRLREPGATEKASIRSEALAARSKGITKLVCAPDTKPCIDSSAVVELILERARLAQGARVYPLGALSRGMEEEALSEMATLRLAGCVGVSNLGRGIANPLFLRRALQYASTLGLTVFLQPIEPSLWAEGVAHDGRIAASMGLPGVPELAETLALSRDLMLIEDTGVKAHIARVSCARSLAMIADAKQRGLPITCDVSIAQLLFQEYDVAGFNSAFRVMPPLRTQADRDALIDGLATGLIDVLVSDHQPHDRDAKLAPFPEAEPGMSMLDVFLSLGLKLVHEGRLSVSRWLDATVFKPQSLIAHAAQDWVLIDPHLELNASDNWLSRGRNSPCLNWVLPGKVLEVFMEGADGLVA
jgi:dihydroorotase